MDVNQTWLEIGRIFLESQIEITKMAAGEVSQAQPAAITETSDKPARQGDFSRQAENGQTRAAR
jgi:hypothetical protein